MISDISIDRLTPSEPSVGGLDDIIVESSDLAFDGFVTHQKPTVLFTMRRAAPSPVYDPPFGSSVFWSETS
ncbi:hypothetical protein QCA50_002567 [Cerrena zonata]|uniref:Uncharacterized protein n=1 Tax=Cerrena zonata TaxID=2478898 RepID=A0AAW0GM78_9APHY